MARTAIESFNYVRDSFAPAEPGVYLWELFGRGAQ